MLVSVLIANYNNSRFLENALRSILAQGYENWEIVLVDDHSTDNFEAVAALFATDKRIRIHRNEKNFGCGYTKRKCATLASGELLAFLDPDDALEPDALQTMKDAHFLHTSCSLIHSTHYVCDEALIIKRIADYPRALPPDTPYLLVNDGRIHHFATFKKAAYDRTEGISPLNKRSVDQDLYYKLEEEGGILFIDRPLYRYRIHGGSISNSGNEAATVLCHYAIIEEACLRRIKAIKQNRQREKDRMRQYWTRYYKIRVLKSFRQKKWERFFISALMYPFVGGLGNMMSYIRKLPKGGIGLLRKSFLGNYEIKA